jgi:hypothetical protein
MVTRLKNLIFSPIFVALALGGFSIYLVTEGEVEAAMGGTGAAIAAATMKRNEESEEDYEVLIRNQLRIQALEIEAQNRKYLEEQKEENIYLRFQIEIKEKEALLSLREQEFKHKIEMLMKEQEVADPKALPEQKETEELQELSDKIKMLMEEQEVADPKVLPEQKETESQDSKDNSS